jgi:hypothetical protein
MNAAARFSAQQDLASVGDPVSRQSAARSEPEKTLRKHVPSQKRREWVGRSQQ